MLRDFPIRFPRTWTAIDDGTYRGLQVGVQLSVSIGGRVVGDIASGMAHPDQSLTTDTILPWFSSAKPVAAVAIAQLWEQGRIDLEAPVADYVPEFAAGGKAGITIRHLLTHTGGFRKLELNWREEPWEATIAQICAMPLEAEWIPGETAGYHVATSWFMLGELIRRIDGRPYSRYVREAIFEPLGMHDTWVGMPPEKFQEYGDRLVPMVNTIRGGGPESPTLQPNWWTACHPGGNGCGPIRELRQFYEMLLGEGTREGVTILAPETVRLFTTPHRIGKHDQTMQHVMDWGLGFIVDSKQYGPQTVPYGFGVHCSPRTFGHGGYQSSAGFCDPDRQLAVGVVFNGTPGEPWHNRRIRAFCTALYEDLDQNQSDDP